MLPLNLCFKKSSKLSLTPNYSSAYVSKPILIIDSMSTLLFALGDLTTMMKSYSAFGPSLSVIRLVSSFDTGFSMYQASCLISLFTITAPFLSLVSDSRLKGKVGLSNFCFIWSFLQDRLLASTDSSTIYSHSERFPTLRVDPSILPGKKELQFKMCESTNIIFLMSTYRLDCFLAFVNAAVCSFNFSFSRAKASLRLCCSDFSSLYSSSSRFSYSEDVDA